MTYGEPQMRPLEVNNEAGCSAKASLPELYLRSHHTFGHSPHASCSSSAPGPHGVSPSVPHTLPSLCAVSFLLAQQLTAASSAKLILLPRLVHPCSGPTGLLCCFNPLQGDSHSREGLCSFMSGSHPQPEPSTEEVSGNVWNE